MQKLKKQTNILSSGAALNKLSIMYLFSPQAVRYPC